MANESRFLDKHITPTDGIAKDTDRFLMFDGAWLKTLTPVQLGVSTTDGLVLSAAQTAALNVFAEDNALAIASAQFVRAGRFRMLLGYNGTQECEAGGAIGQLVVGGGGAISVNHNTASIWGSWEITATDAVTVTGTSGDNIHAGILGRVGAGASATLTVATDGILAGVAAMSNVNSSSTATYTGKFTAFYAGAWASADVWEQTLYAAAAEVKQFLVLGGGTSGDTGTAGTVLQAGTLSAPVDINTASAFGVKVFTRSTSTAAHTNARFRAIGNAASGTPTVEGVLAQASVADAKYAGAIQGLVASTRVGSASVCGGAASIITAARFKTEDARATDGTSTAPTYAGNVYGITVQGQISAAPTGDYIGIHFDCQTAAASTAQPWDAVFDFQIGGQNANITNLFNFPTGGGWATSGKMIVHGGAAAAAVAGYLHIAVNGTQYRIPYLANSDS